MIKHLFYILKLLRPRQWIKNFALYAAITFGGQLFIWPVFLEVTLGFIAFSFLASSTYVINDLLDVKKDRLHPFKRNRPIASGKVSVPEAIALFLILFTSSLLIAASIDILFVGIALIYILFQIAYSFFFKSLVIFDILIIASGYILRVLAGEVISGYHISAWLLLTVVCISLFLAVAKRRSELTLLRSYKGTKIEEVRASLSHYSTNLLDGYSTMFATATLVFYAFFTFLEDPAGVKISIDIFLPEYLPEYLQRKWLMVTIIPVVYGIMRYMQDIYEKHLGESPEKVIQSDKALLSSVIVWIILVILVIYVLPVP